MDGSDKTSRSRRALGRALQLARRRVGLSTAELAFASQLQPETLDELESGRAPLDPAGLLRACLALRKSPKELFGDHVSGDRATLRAVKHMDLAFAIHEAVRGSRPAQAVLQDGNDQELLVETWWIREGYWLQAAGLSHDGKAARLLERGAIALRASPEFVWLCWHVDKADDASLEQAMDYLDGLKSDHLVLFKFYKSAWARERFAGPRPAIERIKSLMSYKSVDVALQTSIRRLQLPEIRRAHPLLQHAMSDWLDARMDTYWPATSSADWALVFDRDCDELLFSHIGRASEARRRLGADWRQAAIGANCHNGFIDSNFNKRADEAYWTAIEERVPVLNHVLAYIKTHDGADWLPYQRLTLPTRHGVAVFTKVTPDISIPFLGRAA